MVTEPVELFVVDVIKLGIAFEFDTTDDEQFDEFGRLEKKKQKIEFSGFILFEKKKQTGRDRSSW